MSSWLQSEDNRGTFSVAEFQELLANESYINIEQLRFNFTHGLMDGDDLNEIEMN